MILPLLLLPLLGAIALLFFKKPQWASRFFLTVCSLQLLLTIALLIYAPEQSTAINMRWLPEFGIRLKFGYDGLSLIMLLLTSVVMWLIGLASQHSSAKHPGYFSLLLVSQASLTAFFTAQDLFLFYVFWELSVVPFFLSGYLWGRQRQPKTSLTFILYSLVSSLCLLLPITFIYATRFSFSGLFFPSFLQIIICGVFFIAFAIKTPLFPFHAWQPPFYDNNRTENVMLLSSLLSKLGLYGMIRILLGFFPMGFVMGSGIVAVLALVGILVGGFLALSSRSLTKVLAYSSIAHLSLVILGIFTSTIQGLQGSIFQMFAHGLSAAGLFYCCGLLYDHFGTADLDKLGGLRKQSPLFAIAFFVCLLSSIGLPLTSGFIGELLMLSGVYSLSPLYALIAGSSLIFGAWYMLKSYKEVCLGTAHDQTTLERFILKPAQKAVLAGFIVLIVIVGIFPQPILHLSEPVVNALLYFGALS
jgi:NADH-quinone oxidoreductase subunit M